MCQMVEVAQHIDLVVDVLILRHRQNGMIRMIDIRQSHCSLLLSSLLMLMFFLFLLLKEMMKLHCFVVGN